MKGSIRWSVAATAVVVAFLTVAASPALGQAGNPDAGPYGSGVQGLSTFSQPVGGVLAASGGRTVAGPATQVLPVQVSGVGAGAAGTQQARVEGLAFTGADIATMVVIGLSALAVGVILTRRGRPRARSAG